jgi:Protein of unknown function (DUF3768)
MADNKVRIRELNDQFRTTFDGGRIVFTAGIDALAEDVKEEVVQKVANYDDFTADNDPHGEHDFGLFKIAEHTFYWKLDYYDADGIYGSEDPSDPQQTTRVLTVMLNHEY